MTSRDASRLDVPQLPRNQDADKQNDRKPDTKRQRADHVGRFALVRQSALRATLPVAAHHEKQGAAQAANDQHKRKHDKVFHGLDYPVTASSRFWLITMAALISVMATLSLGRWQLARAAQKESLQAAIDSQAKLPRLDNRSLAAGADGSTALHRTVNLRGAWVAGRTVFLDNRQMNAKPGLYVFTPLLLEGSQQAVLVQRGWVARNFIDRASVPTIAAPTGVVEIEGRIAPPPSKLYELGDPERGLIRQNLDLAHFRGESGLPLLEFTVQQTGAATEGLLRDWPVASAGSAKNYGYAFQWFGLSALIAILYVWFQIGKRFTYPRRT